MLGVINSHLLLFDFDAIAINFEARIGSADELFCRGPSVDQDEAVTREGGIMS